MNEGVRSLAESFGTTKRYYIRPGDTRSTYLAHKGNVGSYMDSPHPGLSARPGMPRPPGWVWLCGCMNHFVWFRLKPEYIFYNIGPGNASRVEDGTRV